MIISEEAHPARSQYDMSDKLIIILIGFYAVILVISAIEKNWIRCLYWLGAILIIIASMRMR